MSKILLVGGAGYVGSILTAELLERGFDVKIFDRLYYGKGGLCDVGDRARLLVGDMRVLPENLLDDVDAVVNVGGLSNDPTAEYNPTANYEMNTQAATALARSCIERGVRRYVFASSCSVYDRGVGDDDLDLIQDEAQEVTPRAAYSSSKWEAEKQLLDLAEKHESFCPVILRKGTIYGFSPRMRYDLVVNTFVKDALQHGRLTLRYGGEMWRPLVDVHDVARAYLIALQAPEPAVRGQVFNVAYANMRISELALRVRAALAKIGIETDIDPDYGYSGVRSYRVSTKKMRMNLDFEPKISVEEAVQNMVRKISEYRYNDFENPRYYNIQWMRFLEDAQETIDITGSVFEAPH